MAKYNVLKLLVKMKNLLILPVFLSSIVVTCAWDDYTDYYEDSTPTTVTVEANIGTKLLMQCQGPDYSAFWKHNDKEYHPGFTILPNIDWPFLSEIEVTITSYEDGGKWECCDFDACNTIYEVTIKPQIETTTSSPYVTTPRHTTTTTSSPATETTYSIPRTRTATVPSPLTTRTTTTSLPVRTTRQYQWSSSPATRTTDSISTTGAATIPPPLTARATTTTLPALTTRAYLLSSTTSRTVSNLAIKNKEGGEGMLADTFMNVISNSISNPFFKAENSIKASAASLSIHYMALFVIFVVNI